MSENDLKNLWNQALGQWRDTIVFCETNHNLEASESSVLENMWSVSDNLEPFEFNLI